jgi:hypothetical protein
MDPRAESLLRRFAEIESSEEIVTTFVDGAPTEPVSQQHAEVTAVLPEQGIVELRHEDATARLHCAEADLLRLLHHVGREASEAWGEPLSGEESAARFLSVWLDESLATRDPHPSGWWVLQGSGFDPVPPWEAHARRRPRT